ncbi:MAG: SAM-dependent chlorinase/fluorinase [Deltaproteobacteria bacterium]|nr:SAM-dependent chlorinase/fluorinase [Deltaproteobacteria bacterium]
MKPSGIITLLTDFGLSDPYGAMMKGVILSINPNAHPVDISHQVRTGSIIQASGIILDAFPFFPKGTVHVGVVDPGVGGERRLLAIEANDHFFVGPDNGIFWPLIQKYRADRIVQLIETRYFLPHVTRTFHGRDVFAPVSAHISLGVGLEEMGPPLEDPIQADLPRPRLSEGLIQGQIVHVDHFGNLITNIGRKELEDLLGTSRPVIEVGALLIEGLSQTYGDAEEGQPLALINSSDMLEIAVNLGRASRYAGFDQEEIIGMVVTVGKG